MTVTVLPGVAEGASAPPPPHRPAPSRRTALVAAAAVLIASGLGFGGYELLGGHSSGAAPAPTPHPVHSAPAPAATTPTERAKAAAAPAFAAMNTALGGWQAKGAIRVKRQPVLQVGGHHVPRCVQHVLAGPTPLTITSPHYVRQLATADGLTASFNAQGEIDRYATAAAAARAFRRVEQPAALACLRSSIATQGPHRIGGRALTGSRVGVRPVHGHPHVLRFVYVAGFTEAGRTFAVKVDVLTTQVARTIVATTMVAGLRTPHVARELPVLRTLAAQARTHFG